jgi:TolB-like protein
LSLFAELQRRNVFRVAAAYLALGWVVVQATDILVPALKLPEGLISTVVWIGVVGFPFALLFAWAYELTPEGLKREHEVDRNQSITQATGRRLDLITIALLIVALAVFAFDRLVPRDAPPWGGADIADAAPLGEGHASVDAAASPGRGQGPLLQEGNTRAQRPAPPDSNAAAPDAKSIAVLPFVNMSSDKEQEYFSDGIAEELLNLLAKIPELKVAARTSSFSFKGKDTEIAEIARRLNVAHVLEGSVRKSGIRVRITAQLIRAADGYHLWSETWDRTLEDIFAVQDEIAAAVVSQMKITLLGKAPKSRATDPRAYPLFLRARQLAESGTAESLPEAERLFEQGLAIDPGYAEAWRKLAAIANLRRGLGLLSAEESVRQQREYIARALAIDPEFGRAHDGLGFIAKNHDLDMAAAARHYTRALELDPTNLNILYNTAFMMAALGRMEQAIAIGEYVNQRDPLSPQGHADIAFAYILAGRLDESIATGRTALSLSPGYLGAWASIGLAMLLKGDARAALEAARQEPSEMLRLATLAPVHHALGQAAESDAALAALSAGYERSAAYSIAAVFAWRGDNDRVFEWLDKALRYHDGNLDVLAWDPQFAKVHGDPRWPALLHAHGLAPEQLAAIAFDVKIPE